MLSIQPENSPFEGYLKTYTESIKGVLSGFSRTAPVPWREPEGLKRAHIGRCPFYALDREKRICDIDIYDIIPYHAGKPSADKGITKPVRVPSCCRFSAETGGHGPGGATCGLYRRASAMPYSRHFRETAQETDGAMTLGARSLNWLRGELVGMDSFGNRYYRDQHDKPDLGLGVESWMIPVPAPLAAPEHIGLRRGS
jgi:hypothetical protein